MNKKINLNKLPDITRGRMDRSRVFADFLTLMAIRISNRVDPVHYHQRNAQGRSIGDVYTDSEYTEMLQYFEAIVHQITKNQKMGVIVDILGRLLEEFGLSRNGQDQSPSDVARVLAHLGLGKEPKVPETGYFTLSECACGSGSLILAVAETLLAKDINYCEQLVVLASDLDLRCVHMAYIQLSMYGIPAVVIHGDTLTLKEFSRWYTPMYILRNWVWRQPLGFTDGKNPVDKQLRRETTPLYAAMRWAQELSDP